MNRIVAAPIVSLLALLGGSASTQADPTAGVKAEEPVLLKIGYVFNGKPVVLPVSIKSGTTKAPKPGQVTERWRITPGHAVKSRTQPAARVVEFYQGQGNRISLVLQVDIRYFRDKTGHWLPHFLPNEIPLVGFDGKQWKPVTQMQGKQNLLVMHGASLPNAEGFYPSLDFGLTLGRSSIDAWTVR